MLEQEIIERCLKADRSALERLYIYYSPKLKGICLRYARTNFEAEDILQDAFIKILRNITNFQNQGSFDGWIKRIVVNTAIDHYKKNSSSTSKNQPLDMFDDKDIGVVEIIDQLSANELLALIEKLPEGYKMVFNLYAIDGYNHKEIGDMLNITEGTSKSQLAKARKYLQKLLLNLNSKDNKSIQATDNLYNKSDNI